MFTYFDDYWTNIVSFIYMLYIYLMEMVKLDSKAKISIVGSGFTPGQEISLVFTDVNGIQANIADYLKPEPTPNKSGAWYTTWSCGRYISRKLIKEGAYIITVTDRMYNPLAQAAVAFYQTEDKK